MNKLYDDFVKNVNETYPTPPTFMCLLLHGREKGEEGEGGAQMETQTQAWN